MALLVRVLRVDDVAFHQNFGLPVRKTVGIMLRCKPVHTAYLYSEKLGTWRFLTHLFMIFSDFATAQNSPG